MGTNSLRRRLVLTMAVGGIAILSVVALLSQRAMTREFGVFLERELPQFRTGPPDLTGYRDEIMTCWEPGWNMARLGRTLKGIEADLEHEYRLTMVSLNDGDNLVFDGGGHPFAGDHRIPWASSGEEHYVIYDDETGNHARFQLGDELAGGQPELRLVDEAGASVGLLIATPKLKASAPEMEERFVGSLTQWLLLTALVAGVIGVWMVSAVAKRIVGPVEELTGAARRMARGELDQRIEVHSEDEIGSLAKAFNHMAESLKRSERNRQSLISDTAHELRTPLTNVRCQLEALQDGLIVPDPETYQSLHEEIVHLGRLVNDLQELSLAEAGALRIDMQGLDLGREVRRTLSTVAPREGMPTLSNRVAAGVLVRADPMRLHQILSNLVANALANTSGDGEVRVECRRSADRVEVSVVDTGVGMAPEELPFVFERLYRTDPSRSRETGGVGLGLAIVKGLVEAQGGHVGVESEPGIGTRVWFTLRTT